MRLGDRRAYVEAFREIFERAVRARLRTRGGVAVSMSGGLDSSSVAVTAAAILKKQGGRLDAFTSVPRLPDPERFRNHFGDERAQAEAVAATGEMTFHPIEARNMTPLASIRRAMRIHLEPMHSAGNYYWMIDLQTSVRAHGHRVLLTGHMGNSGISWKGKLESQPLLELARFRGPSRALKPAARRIAPRGLLGAWTRWRLGESGDAWSLSGIAPSLVRRLDLADRRRQYIERLPLLSPRGHRHALLLPGRSSVGAFNAQLAAAHGLSGAGLGASP